MHIPPKQPLVQLQNWQLRLDCRSLLPRCSSRPSPRSKHATSAMQKNADWQLLTTQIRRTKRGSRCTAAALPVAPPAMPPTSTVMFEPHVDPTVLYGQLAVLALTLGAAAYWWWSVVPSARRTLAKEKR